MRDLVELIIGKYDGSLKAEHGTGINMAPVPRPRMGRGGSTDYDVAESRSLPTRTKLGPNVHVEPRQLDSPQVVQVDPPRSRTSAYRTASSAGSARSVCPS